MRQFCRGRHSRRKFLPLLGAHPGSLGAVRSVPAEFHVVADERLRGANDMTTGANEDGFHLRNVSIERDIKVTKWLDLRTVTAPANRASSAASR